jgi:hypothetical protein
MFKFWKQKPAKLLVLEREAPKPIEKPDGATQEAIISLQYHPGFQYLMEKLRWQRSLLVTALTDQRQDKMADVEFLKSGIAWTRWLEDQISTEIRLKTRTRPQIPTDFEQEALAQAKSMIEEVG